MKTNVKRILIVINSFKIIKTLTVKSLLTSLYQREEFPSLAKRGKGRFFNQCQFKFEPLNKKYLKLRNGFTLLEIIVVIGIISLMVGILIPMVYRVWESSEVDKTKERISDLKKAMTGDPKLIQNGVRTHFGYVGDIGQLPSSLGNLITNDDGVANWNGPYLPSGFDPNDYATDAWGKPIYYTSPSIPGELMELRSYGPDRSSGNSDDIVVKIYSNEVFPTNNVQGAINITFNSAPSTTLSYSAKIYAKYRDGTGNLTNTLPICYSPVSIPGDGSTRYFPIPFNVNLGVNIPIGPVYFSATLFSVVACTNIILGQTEGGGPNNPEILVNVNDRVSSVFTNLPVYSVP
jgi:general secretion pathway protein G